MNTRESNQNLWILTIGMFFMSVGYTMIIPFLPVYLIELGVPKGNVPFWSGFVFSITFLIAGIMAPIWGKMSDKKGRKLMVMRAGFALGATYLMGALAIGPWSLLFVRALMGFANGFMPAAMTLITTSIAPSRVGYALGVFQTGLIAGQVIGPFVGGLMADWFGMRPAFLIVGAMMTLATVACVFWVKEPDEIRGVETYETSIVKDISLAFGNKRLLELLILFFINQGVILMLQPIITLYVAHLMHTRPADAGIIAGAILSLGGAIGAFMTPWWGKFGQRNGYFRTVFFGLSTGGVAIVLQGLIGHVWLLAILQVVIGLFAYSTTPALSAMVALCTKTENRGRAYGLVTTAQQFGSMTGPLIVSGLTFFMDFGQVYVVTGCIMLTTAAVVWKRHHKAFGTVK